MPDAAAPLPPVDVNPDGTLPDVGPDNIEQDFPELLDNIIPSKGYQLLPLIALGGSAGAIGALQTFFKHLPANPGVAFVVVLHLSPEHESSLAELLGRHTGLRVTQANDGDKVLADHVYVIPPGKFLTCNDGHLALTDLSPEHGKRVAVDLLFRTLADTHGPHAAAVVLSGADGDGAIGLKRVKERGGLTVAQDPDEADHSGMPRSAIATGMVDWVLPVAEMPGRILEYLARERRLQLPAEDGPQPARAPRAHPDETETALREVLAFLRAQTGRDFTYYKRATIVRRISRRLQVNGMETLPEYLGFLRSQPGEAGALLQDLLISVTNFFRDREAFAALEARIPELFAGKGPGDCVRVWVAACATGEEAYSIAMLLMEHARTLPAPPAIQIFATDLDEAVIHCAREGVYPATIAADVNEDRLRRFFLPDPRGWRVRREVREVILFALHDLLKDSPFSRLDLVSCRNLLIYLNREAQVRALDTFHFSLRPEGRLFLGTSESAEDDPGRFDPLDKRFRLYAPRFSARPVLPVPTGPGALQRALEARMRGGAEAGPFVPVVRGLPGIGGLPATALERGLTLSEQRGASWGDLHFRLIERFAPPSLIVNADHAIVHLSENAGRFLQFAGGEPTNNVLRVIHPMLRLELRAALSRAAETGATAEATRVPVELNGPAPKVDGDLRAPLLPQSGLDSGAFGAVMVPGGHHPPGGPNRVLVNLRVMPARELAPGFLLIVLEELPAPPPVHAATVSGDGDGRELAPGTTAHAEARAVAGESLSRQLEHELEGTKQQLRDTVEQYEANGEELKASNEELQAINEELRSATEELETSREELQSINEELSAVNGELKGKLDELGHANSDLHNLMAATAIPIVFLDAGLRIMRFTPSAVGLFRLLPGDVGRPLTDLRHALDYPELRADAETVFDTLVPKEREVSTTDGRRWFLARLLPYRTTEDRIGGVVLTFIDISTNKRAEETLRASREALSDQLRLFDTTLNTMPDFAYRFDRMGRFVFANQALCDLLRRPAEEIEGRDFYDLGYPPELAGRLQVQVEQVFVTGDSLMDTMPFTSPAGNVGFHEYIFAPLRGADGKVEAVVGSTRDITERRRTEDDLRASEERLRLATEAARLGMCDYHYQLGEMRGNAERFRLYGLAPDPVDRVMPVEEFYRRIHPEDRERVRVIMENGINGPGEHAEEYRTVWPDGTVRWIYESGRVVERREGKPWRVLAALFDITDRREAEAAIRESEARTRALTENLPAGAAFIVDTGLRFLLARGEALRTVGLDPASLEGRTVMETMDPEQADVYVAHYRRALLGENFRVEHRLGDHTFITHGGPLRGSDGVIHWALAVSYDVTDLKRAEEALQLALADAENARAEAVAAGQAKDQFFAVLSHELRTPLTPVLMAARTLARRRDLPATVTDALAMIARNVQLEAGFIDDLLDLTRISRGKLEIVRAPMDLHEAVRRAVEVSGGDLEAKAQTLTVALDAPVHATLLDGDFNRLQQVFWNLLKNAAKFTPEGGTITVRSRPAGHGRVAVDVIDTGIGIEAGALDRIFRPFEQADADITRRFGGLGLGLAISQATVEAHAGTLSAASPGRGHGATFTVELPVTLQAEGADASS